MKNRHRVSQVVGKLILVTAAGARARPASGRQAANQGRGKADRGQLRQAAGAFAQIANRTHRFNLIQVKTGSRAALYSFSMAV
jgi:hypothetical protein